MFSDDGALSVFYDEDCAPGALCVDSLGPFEGVTTGEVLTLPDSAGTIAIETSIGAISTEWAGVFTEASADSVATLNGTLDGEVEVDLSELSPLLTTAAVAYVGSFESVRTGDLPEDEDTGSAPDTGMDDPALGTDSGGSETGESAGGETSVDGTTPGGSETGDTAGDAGGGAGSPTGTGGGSAEATAGGDSEGTTGGDDTPPIDPTGGPTPE